MSSLSRYQVAPSAPTKWLFSVEGSQLLHTNHSDGRGGEQQVFVRACVRERRDLQYKDILICFKLILLSMLMILLVAGRMDPLTQKSWLS